MEKTCSRCQENKPLEDFYRNKNKANGINWICKTCQKAYNVAWQAKNKETVNAGNKKRRKENQAFITEYRKKCKCSKCGEKRHYLLDFHHTNPTTKEFRLAQASTFSKERILKEIKKCILLCANCHRELHYFERQAK